VGPNPQQRQQQAKERAGAAQEPTSQIVDEGHRRWYYLGTAAAAAQREPQATKPERAGAGKGHAPGHNVRPKPKIFTSEAFRSSADIALSSSHLLKIIFVVAGLVCSEKNKTEEALKLLSEAMSQARDAKTSRGSERIAAFKQAKQLSQRVIDMPLPTDASYERLSLCFG
jgi:hypothetical protein